jgi:hypothetical protein
MRRWREVAGMTEQPEQEADEAESGDETEATGEGAAFNAGVKTEEN